MSTTITLSPETADWSDLCLRVSGDEVQSDDAFQCSDCGHQNQARVPRFSDGYWARTCSICDKEYPLHDWTP